MWAQVTAKQIAQAMGITERGARDRAAKELWTFEERTCRGGKRRFYPVESLPAEVRQALARVAASEAASAGRHEALRLRLDKDLARRAAEASRNAGNASFVGLADSSRTRAEARAAIVAAFQSFGLAVGMSDTMARHLFADQYNQGQILVDPFVREMVPSVSAGSLRNWTLQLQSGGLARLAGNYGHRRGCGWASKPEVSEFIQAMLTDHPHCSAKHILRGMIARFGAEKCPTLRNLQRIVSDYKTRNAATLLKIANPDGWRSKFQAAAGSLSAHVVRINQRWEIDSTKGDVMLEGRRYVVVGVIDVYTRRLCLHVSPSSSSAAVAACLRKAIVAWGVPEVLVTDNGSDYVSRHITMALAALGVTQDLAPPFTPEHKPHIERAFKTFSHGLVELLGNFIGHDVAGRKEIESRRSFAARLGTKGESVSVSNMGPVEFQAFCDKWANDLYAMDSHEGLGGKSPWQVAAAWAQDVRRADERALDVLLSTPADGEAMRTVRKQGLKVDGRWHIHAELGLHVGKRVRVLLDESDVGAVYVFAPNAQGEFEFACRAVDPDVAGVSRQEVAVAMKAKQKRETAAQVAMLKSAARKLNTKDIVTDILTDAAVKAGKMTRLPHAAVPHVTPMLEEAAKAARAGDEQPVRRATEAEKEQVADLKREAVVKALPETPRARWNRWRKLDGQIAAGLPVSEEEATWHRNYQATDEFFGWSATADLSRTAHAGGSK